MSNNNNLKFGDFIRTTRLNLNIGLREFAKQVGISAAYISQVETGDKLPNEENINKMAKILKVDADKLQSMADKISPDLKNIINDKPDLYASFLRRVKPKDIEKIMKDLDAKKPK